MQNFHMELERMQDEKTTGEQRSEQEETKTEAKARAPRSRSRASRPKESSEAANASDAETSGAAAEVKKPASRRSKASKNGEESLAETHVEQASVAVSTQESPRRTRARKKDEDLPKEVKAEQEDAGKEAAKPKASRRKASATAKGQASNKDTEPTGAAQKKPARSRKSRARTDGEAQEPSENLTDALSEPSSNREEKAKEETAQAAKKTSQRKGSKKREASPLSEEKGKEEGAKPAKSPQETQSSLDVAPVQEASGARVALDLQEPAHLDWTADETQSASLSASLSADVLDEKKGEQLEAKTSRSTARSKKKPQSVKKASSAAAPETEAAANAAQSSAQDLSGQKGDARTVKEQEAVPAPEADAAPRPAVSEEVPEEVSFVKKADEKSSEPEPAESTETKRAAEARQEEAESSQPETPVFQRKPKPSRRGRHGRRPQRTQPEASALEAEELQNPEKKETFEQEVMAAPEAAEDVASGFAVPEAEEKTRGLVEPFDSFEAVPDFFEAGEEQAAEEAEEAEKCLREQAEDSGFVAREGAPKQAQHQRHGREAAVQPAPRKVNRKMFFSVLAGERIEVALTSEGKLCEYYLDMQHQKKLKGNIYKGIIQNIDTNLQAAFVNYGTMKNGFLQIDEIHSEYWLTHYEPTKGNKFPPIQKVIKPGQEVLVQVVKEPTGNKGAFLTTWLSLAGRFLVLTPGQEQIGVSRKVVDEAERARLKELINGIDPGEDIGVIVRTVSAGTTKTTLKNDLQYLKRIWKEIRKKGTELEAPALIYSEPCLVERAVRDYLTEDVTEIWVDDEGVAETVRNMVNLLFPRKKDLVHLYVDKRQGLWDRFNLRRQIEQINAREVFLPSGGRLVFDQTEALMAVDVNSGKISCKGNFETMAYKTNMEAAESIAKQLRLRDVGGQVVIDFIEMRDRKHVEDVERNLRMAMKADRARYDIEHMSSFGLLELVRQRTGYSAISITQEPCPYCGGTGQRRNLEWQSLQVANDIQRQMRFSRSPVCVFETSTELGMYLLNHKREMLQELEQMYDKKLEIRLRPSV